MQVGMPSDPDPETPQTGQLRRGASSSIIRTRLVRAGREILMSDGLEALTARRVAAAVGLKRQIVHYYFTTMSDLVAEIIERQSRVLSKNVASAAGEEDPIAILAEMSENLGFTVVFLELLAYGLRHENVKQATSSAFREVRAILEEALQRSFETRGIRPAVSPAAALVMVNAIGQSLALERRYGLSAGHEEAGAIFARMIESYLATGRLITGARMADQGMAG